jgi:FkbM family methyltransferase
MFGREKMYFDFGQSSFIDSQREHKNEGIVDVTTLDKFEKGYTDKRVLMVLDAEGYEKNIIEGGMDFISQNKPTIIFEINENALRSAGSSSKELCSILKKNRI